MCVYYNYNIIINYLNIIFLKFNDDCDTKRRLIENYYVYIISAASDIEKIFYEVRRVNGDYMYFIESKDVCF